MYIKLFEEFSMSDANTIIAQFKAISDKILPKFIVNYKPFNFNGGDYINIRLVTTKYIDKSYTNGQHPEAIVLDFNLNTEELEKGSRFFVWCKKNNKKTTIDIPFKKPKNNLKGALETFTKVCNDYKEIIKEIYEEGLSINPDGIEITDIF